MNKGRREVYSGWIGYEIDTLREMFGRRSWLDILFAIPGRSKGSINQYARKTLGLRREVNRRERWTDIESQILKNMWPTASLQDIHAALLRHTPAGIEKQASAINAKRKSTAQRRAQRKVHPVLVQMRETRERKNITRKVLSVKTGYHVNQLLGWELGKVNPTFQSIVDIASVLGFDVVLRERVTKAMLDAEVIPYPDRKKLMAGR